MSTPPGEVTERAKIVLSFDFYILYTYRVLKNLQGLFHSVFVALCAESEEFILEIARCAVCVVTMIGQGMIRRLHTAAERSHFG